MKFVPTSFSIIKPRNNKIINVVIFIIAVVAIAIKLFTKEYVDDFFDNELFLIVMVPIIIYLNYIFFVPSFIKTKNTIRFESAGIILTIKNQKTVIETANILTLKLHLESCDQGMPLTLVDYSRKQKRGNGNTILIQTEAFTYNCEFYIGTKNDMLHLIKALNTWQIEGLNIEIDRSKWILSN